MTKVASFVSLGFIHFDSESEDPLYRQLYNSIRHEILAGRLKPGSRLPSTRGMAQELSLSRNTVVRAYDQLMAEGYLEGQIGMGTCVARDLPEEMLTVMGTKAHTELESSHDGTLEAKPILSQRGEAVMPIPYRWEMSKSGAFSTTIGEMNEFPTKVWEKLLISSWKNLSSEELSYQSSCGYDFLREVLATFLQTSRGVHCTPEQVIITNGAQQALSLSVDLLVNPGDQAWVENPCFNGIRAALAAVKAEIIPVSVDSEGLNPEEGIEKAPHARLAFISPSHQYPLGVTMSLSRRLQLLHWARQENAWIIEDDYDSVYRHSGPPLAALQGLDQSGHVIYVGTLSKVLFPALRIGYMVVPPDLVEPIHTMRAHVDRGSSILEQVVLAHFIDEGHLARHIRRMISLYQDRQSVFIEAVQTYLPGLLTVEPNDTGLHLVGWLPEGADDQVVSQELAQSGIDAAALSSFAHEPLVRSGLVLGYAAVPKLAIIQSVQRMKPILERCVNS
ncbi:MAG: PLP-dependent aminotransferase family protein [Chloroflexota bacterium]